VIISEALEAAHEKAIIRRDLKAANVKITTDGKVKVLDFGLAKAMARTATATALSSSPTLVSGAWAEEPSLAPLPICRRNKPEAEMPINVVMSLRLGAFSTRCLPASMDQAFQPSSVLPPRQKVWNQLPVSWSRCSLIWEHSESSVIRLRESYGTA